LTVPSIVRRRSLRKLLVVAGCLVGRPEGALALAGLALLAAGAVLHLWSKGCLEQNRRLTSAGPYRWTRNPFYLANALIDAGLLAVIGQLGVALVYVPIWLLAYHATIGREEAHLRELFADEFEAYRAAVPRLLPTGRVWPRERVQGRFRLDNPALSQGREYARLLGLALSPWAIWTAARIRALGMDVFLPAHDGTLGLIVLLPVGWVVKLALAETFRRPEVRLLPFAERPELRSAIALAVTAGALLASGPGRGASIVTLGLVVPVLALVAIAMRVDGAAGPRLLAGVVALTIGVALAVVQGGLAAMAAPIGWCALVALDELGELRSGRRSASDRTAWRLLPAVFAGAVATAALLLVGLRP